MKRIALTLLALSLVACTSRGTVQPQPTQAVPQIQPVQAPAAPFLEEGPDVTWVSVHLNRDQLRDGLLRLMNGPGTDPGAKLAAVFERLGSHPYGPPDLPYAAADLDGNGNDEYVIALPVDDPRSALSEQSAAVFVIYHKGGQWAVDRTDPMSDHAEVQLMAPALNGVADLAGTGRPQIVWSRPQSIATGPQPVRVFVTAWKHGAFTRLPGEMAISNGAKDHAMLTIEGKELVLTGGRRGQIFLPQHTDRYRYVDGAFRLVDRRFIDAGATGYDRFWDGLVAEQVGRSADAERSYREATDVSRTPHSRTVARYHDVPVQLGSAELERFGQALRSFARFRLAAMLKETSRKGEVLMSNDDPYTGLLDAMLKAPTRKAGCEAASVWAQAHPEFLAAFNEGVSDERWTPELVCSHLQMEHPLEPNP